LVAANYNKLLKTCQAIIYWFIRLLDYSFIYLLFYWFIAILVYLFIRLLDYWIIYLLLNKLLSNKQT